MTWLNVLGMAVERQEGAILLGFGRLGFPTGASDGLWIKGGFGKAAVVLAAFVEKGLVGAPHRGDVPSSVVCLSGEGQRGIWPGMGVI